VKGLRARQGSHARQVSVTPGKDCHAVLWITTSPPKRRCHPERSEGSRFDYLDPRSLGSCDPGQGLLRALPKEGVTLNGVKGLDLIILIRARQDPVTPVKDYYGPSQKKVSP
jgi:hypothetical protein